MEDSSLCDACLRNGERKELKTFQINFEEAIVLCENTRCTSPLGSLFFVLKRNATDLHKVKRKKLKSLASESFICAKPHVGKAFPVVSTSGPDANPGALSSLGTKSQLSTTPTGVKTPATSCIPNGLSAFQPYRKAPGTVQSQDSGHTVSTCSPSQVMVGLSPPCIPEHDSDIQVGPNVTEVLNGSVTLPATQPFCFVHKNQLRYPQWKNRDALCWLDVAMCLLCHCLDGHSLPGGIVKTLVISFMDALFLLNPLLKSSYSRIALVDKQKFPVKTGGGQVPPKASAATSAGTPDVVSSQFCDIIPAADDIMDAVRERSFDFLQPRLKCVRGHRDSPLFALMSLISEIEVVDKMFRVNYTWEMSCSKCGHHQVDRNSDIVPSLPAMPSNFSMTNIFFARNCFRCAESNQRRCMQFNRLPEKVLFHFTEGVPHARLREYDFTFSEHKYHLTGIIQHRAGPEHFVAWIRDPVGDQWMECDDMLSSVTQYQPVCPDILPSEVHIMLWQRAVESNVAAKVDLKTGGNANCARGSKVKDCPVIDCAKPENVSERKCSDLSCESETAGNANCARGSMVKDCPVIDCAKPENVSERKCSDLSCESETSGNANCDKGSMVKSYPVVDGANSEKVFECKCSDLSDESGVMPAVSSPDTAVAPSVNSQEWLPCVLKVSPSVELGTKGLTLNEDHMQYNKRCRAKQRLTLLQSLKKTPGQSRLKELSHLKPTKPIDPPPQLNSVIVKSKCSSHSPAGGMSAGLDKVMQVINAYKKTSFKGYVSKKQSAESSKTSSPVFEENAKQGKVVKFLLNKASPESVSETSELSSDCSKQPFADKVDSHKMKTNERQSASPTSGLDTSSGSGSDSVLEDLYKVLDLAQADSLLPLEPSNDFISELLSESDGALEAQTLDFNLASVMNTDMDDFDIDKLLFS